MLQGPSTASSPPKYNLETVDFASNTNNVNNTAAAANGIPAPTRPSPTAGSATGKSPYVERSNPMGQGAAQTVTSKDPKAAAQAASDLRNVVRRKLTGYVGFANLPNQWHRKSVRKGFNFNVMVVGMYMPRFLTYNIYTQTLLF